MIIKIIMFFLNTHERHLKSPQKPLFSRVFLSIEFLGV